MSADIHILGDDLSPSQLLAELIGHTDAIENLVIVVDWKESEPTVGWTNITANNLSHLTLFLFHSVMRKFGGG